MGRKRGGVSPEASVHPQIPEDSHDRRQAGSAQSAAKGQEMENWILVAALAVIFGDQGSRRTLLMDSRGKFCCFGMSWSRKPWNRALGRILLSFPGNKSHFQFLSDARPAELVLHCQNRLPAEPGKCHQPQPLPLPLKVTRTFQQKSFLLTLDFQFRFHAGKNQWEVTLQLEQLLHRVGKVPALAERAGNLTPECGAGTKGEYSPESTNT